jgi:hypothetical protein
MRGERGRMGVGMGREVQYIDREVERLCCSWAGGEGEEEEDVWWD